MHKLCSKIVNGGLWDFDVNTFDSWNFHVFSAGVDFRIGFFEEAEECHYLLVRIYSLEFRAEGSAEER